MSRSKETSEDYTDGHGWARLDQAACNGLSDIIATFGSTKMHVHCRILLTLYKSIGNDGKISKRIGYGTIAKAAGVSEASARWLIQKLEKDGTLINTDGIRQFWWMAEGVVPTTPHPVVPTTPPLLLDAVTTTGGGVVTAGSYNTLHTVTDSTKGTVCDSPCDQAAPPEGGPRSQTAESFLECPQDIPLPPSVMRLYGLTADDGGES